MTKRDWALVFFLGVALLGTGYVFEEPSLTVRLIGALLFLAGLVGTATAK